MRGHSFLRLCLFAGLTMAAIRAPFAFAASVEINPAKMPKIGSVSERYQSFNVEMIEVTGGRFWAPYKTSSEATTPPADSKSPIPAGMPASLYRYREPTDLSNQRLRKLAPALGPSYMRVSGTWANSTYFQDSDEPALAKPPEGFNGVLTRKEWKGVVDFAHAVDAEIVTSFAISPGVRDAGGTWTPVEAKKFLTYTQSIGGNIAAAEMFNEPTFASMGGAPKGYDAAQYGRDFRAFSAFAKQAAPRMMILGPGSVGEGQPLASSPGLHLLTSEDILAAAGKGVDLFSYHFYGGVSKRCMGKQTPETALTHEWLFKTAVEEEFYAGLRDRFEPGKAIWLTETGEAACGGDPWASDFIDSFRYLNQLGVLAQRGVQVVMHNTLAASDYALIDEATLTPRPNYWAALLWRKLMGTTVLNPDVAASENFYVYAHCLRGHPGGVALLAVNADRTSAKEIALPQSVERFTLSAADLMGNKVDLNGRPLELAQDDSLPVLTGAKTKAGILKIAPASITFFAIPDAKNASCQ